MKEGVAHIQVYRQPMEVLIGKERGTKCFGGGFQLVDMYDLYKKLCDVWDTMPEDGEELKCLDEEEKILANLGLDMPIDFDVGQHPLRDCSVPALYVDVIWEWHRNLKVHIDEEELYGCFDDGLEPNHYELKHGVDRNGWVSIWPKEIYAAVHAARDGKDYKEYLTRSMDTFLKIGL
jgi:hypothetical protein